MVVTVIFEDDVILIDEEAKFGFDFSEIDPNWRVIQWKNDYGWIEVHSGERIWLNSINTVQPYIDMWNLAS